VRPATALLVAAFVACIALVPPVALGAGPRVSLTAIEDQLMCTSCHEPLALSQSPQGISERAYIRVLIARGESRQQILRDMVAQYGQAVLALPKASGFNLLIYILPPAAVALAAAALAFTLPKWRRRARAAAGAHPELAPELAPEEAKRLEADLSLY
jgi:cytochrome c-type biogenesis protein CcmH/NrfF